MRARNESFGQSVKIRLINRHLSVTGLAERLGYKRNTVSLAIHSNRPGFDKVRQAIRAELDLKEAA